MMKKFKINVKPLDGSRILHFHNVASYHIEDGILTFIDTKNGETKRFAVSNTEIEEMKQ